MYVSLFSVALLRHSLLPHLTTLQTYLLPFCLDSFS
ncbi:Chromosome segregation ATPase [Giardia duodenalis]|uniref:Chromosome segregation ATPase n=1 Tax=Giardia intestinalis TaxID=5741 RepID=V6TU86_GIAIN|nr:Chromosome segregation ATPase [Giardia intestinalis]